MASFDEPKGEKSPSGGSSDSPTSKALTLKTGNTPPPPEPEEEEDGMLRMSFLGHLEELRKRIFMMVIGIAVAFALSLTFSNPLWVAVQGPATDALKSLGIHPPNLVAITPMEAFNIIYFKLPTLVAIFLASPWIVYQVWAFISPGLYKKERRFAAPFILFSAGLFIAGGCFAYFVAFRFGITFLLGVGRDVGISPMVSMSEYFDLFVNVMLGIGLVFELPVILFFLTLIRVVSPKFLIAHSRYAILGIVIVAAVVTPTPDIFNLLLFAVPMCMLFYVGIFASYILVLKREGRRLPWNMILGIVALILALAAGVLVFLIKVLQFHLIPVWPFLIK
jgi:sec-independent protein translocase protein TatC